MQQDPLNHAAVFKRSGPEDPVHVQSMYLLMMVLSWPFLDVDIVPGKRQ